LILDLEIILLYPFAKSAYENGIYGLIIMLIFTFVITIGFIYELCSGALNISSKQYADNNISNNYKVKYNSSSFINQIGIRKFSSSSSSSSSSKTVSSNSDNSIKKSKFMIYYRH